jgi:hypothetical protein
MTVREKILKITRLFYPTGRAWKMPFDGVFEAVHIGLSFSEAQAYSDLTAILDSILPDNDNFTEDDATDWERRVALINNVDLTLEERKQVILAKLQFPGNIPARQSITWITRQLQAQGFDVTAYENLSGLSPLDVSGEPSVLSYIQHGDVQHGDQMHGGYYNNKVVNSIYPEKDFYFNEGGSYRASFFIGGPTLGSFASVPEIREVEFRQAILRVKPAQQVAFLFVNFT